MNLLDALKAAYQQGIDFAVRTRGDGSIADCTFYPETKMYVITSGPATPISVSYSELVRISRDGYTDWRVQCPLVELEEERTVQHYDSGQQVYSFTNVGTSESPIVAGGRYYISSDLSPRFHSLNMGHTVYVFDTLETFSHWTTYIVGTLQYED